ncbi:hypothetical protein [Ruegeria arenilitoris]|uniref:hypothetical protein n=1 Tax=Ruegeria arenilitoris TaxID=1173585 RepID=UPI0014811827|nr:hypothetical protein [Ruegeria arenilitoris]
MFTHHLIHPVHLETETRIRLSSVIREIVPLRPVLCGKAAEEISENRLNANHTDELHAFSGNAFTKSLTELRRNACLEWDLSDLVTSPEPHCDAWYFKLLLMVSGDMCLVYGASFSDLAHLPENPRPYYRDHTLPEVTELVDALVSVLQLRVGSRLEADLDTSIQVVLGGVDTAPFHERLSKLFEEEGLVLEECEMSAAENGDWTIYGGWSYSAIVRKDLAEEFYFVALMFRLQLDWIKARRIRNKIVNTADERAESYHGSKIGELNTALNELIFFLQVARQRRADYRANLKPWLARCYDSTNTRWQIEDNFDSLYKAACDFRNYVGFISDEKSKLQLEIQSKLLYFIAGLDTLAISSFAMTLLSFRRGDSPVLPGWIHQYGPKLLLFLVASNVVLLLVIFVLGFIRKR